MLSGCAGESVDGSGDGGVETTRIRIINAPATDMAPVWVAVEEGFFADEGLEASLESTSAANSAEAAALLVSGEYEFTISNGFAAAQARNQGIDIGVVMSLTLLGGPDDETFHVITTADGPATIEDAIESGKIGNAGIKGAGEIYLMNWIEENGGDPFAATFENVPYGAAEPLLLNDTLAGQVTFGPFLASALSQPDFTDLGSITSALPADSPSILLIATQEFAGANPETIDAVRRAIAKANDWIGDTANSDAFVEIVAEQTGLDPALVEAANLPQYSPDLTADALTRYLEMGKKYGAIQSVPAVSELAVNGALTN